LEGRATADCRRRPQKQVFGAAWPWRNSVRLSCARMHGVPGHARHGKPADEINFDTNVQSGDNPQKGQ
jgi:hypothetical protein